MDFRVNDMLPTAGRPLCAALRLLLSETRLLALPQEKRLAGLLEASRKYQNVVSERLAEQVLHGLYELLRGFQSAHQKSQGRLLKHELEQDPDNVYRALLTVMLRLVFLLYAEERDMLSRDDRFVEHYSIGGLYERLREDAGVYPDTMDDRYGAWAQFLVLFRMVHDGATSGEMRLPRRHGDLFNPSRFPFLEGWHGSGAPQVSQAIEPPLVPDGTVYRVLDKLLVLDGERISYRALDVEQIGSVYETMMGFRLEAATGRSVAIKAQKKGGASTTVDLEQLADVGPRARAKWVQDRTERKLTAAVTKPLGKATNVTDLHAALAKVVDTAATPDLVPRGALILQPSDERRRSGSHYTPRALTEPIVKKALEPLLDRLGNTNVPTPFELLDLKICDPAMGSGAFLVETCRQLAEKLVGAWKVHGGRPDIPTAEDELVFARRLVAQRCVYGVDRNPMAVILAKMSLWLATLAKNEPLTFVDHALRDGDSLVGLKRRQIAAFTWSRGVFQPELGMRIDDAVDDAQVWRGEIRRAARDVPQRELEEMWREADRVLAEVRFYGDFAVEAFFSEAKPAARNRRRLEHLAAVQRRETTVQRERLTDKRNGHPPLAPFHWEIEFPEVFDRDNPGFDAVVGNPPFGGKNTVAVSNVSNYPRWLKQLHEGSHGNSDLVAHFYRRAYDLLRRQGTFGLIATNTIGQGDTRSTGLRWICLNGGEIYRARTRVKWPGLAAVTVSVVHVAKGQLPIRKWLDGRPVEEITAFLFHAGGHDDPARLKANARQSFQGSIVLGMGFTFDDTDAKGIATPLGEMHQLTLTNPRNADVIFPHIGGQELNTSPTHSHHRYVISFWDYPLLRARLEKEWRNASGDERLKWLRQGTVPSDYPDPVAEDWPELLSIVREKVKPDRDRQKRKALRERWWQYAEKRPGLYGAIADLDRVLAISQVSQYAPFAFLPTGMVYSQRLNIFPFTQYAVFCALQSRPHEIWARFFGSTLEDRLTYTPSDVFETFPFPRNWTTDPTLEVAGEAYYNFRADLMARNNQGLTKTYNRFHDPEDDDPDIANLRALHEDLDRVVLDAYGWTDVPTGCQYLLDYPIDDEEWSPRKKRPYRYRWPDHVRDEVLARLMEMNAQRADEERRDATR